MSEQRTKLATLVAVVVIIILLLLFVTGHYMVSGKFPLGVCSECHG